MLPRNFLEADQPPIAILLTLISHPFRKAGPSKKNPVLRNETAQNTRECEMIRFAKQKNVEKMYGGSPR